MSHYLRYYVRERTIRSSAVTETFRLAAILHIRRPAIGSGEQPPCNWRTCPETTALCLKAAFCPRDCRPAQQRGAVPISCGTQNIRDILSRHARLLLYARDPWISSRRNQSSRISRMVQAVSPNTWYDRQTRYQRMHRSCYKGAAELRYERLSAEGPTPPSQSGAHPPSIEAQNPPHRDDAVEEYRGELRY